MYSVNLETKKQLLSEIEVSNVKKLGTVATYFSLLKGFVAIGILYMPKNTRNGGWLFTLCTMIMSFLITYYSCVGLLKARDKVPLSSSFAEIASHAVGQRGKHVVNVFLTIMQYGFVISFTYFVLESLKSVVDEIFETDIKVVYIGLIAFGITAPLCLVRKIEKFAFTFLIADFLILATAITIVVYASIHVSERGSWGEGI